MKDKSIYEMEIHEKIYIIRESMCVVKVHNGWIYYHLRSDSGVFVPEQ